MIIFKCRCISYLNQRTTGVWLMSGKEYSVHDSLAADLKHPGLNRTLYQLTDVDAWIENTDPELEETFWKPVTRKRRRLKYSFKNNHKTLKK